MKDYAIKGFALVALTGAAMVLGPTCGAVGLMAAKAAGAGALITFAGIAVGGAVGYGITAGLSQIKVRNRTILDYAIS